MVKNQRKFFVVILLVIVAALCSVLAISCSSESKFTVSFDTDGHGSISSMKKVEEGTVIILPEPEEEEGYVFDGWYLDASRTGTSYAAGSEYTVTENTTFYGKFIEGAYITLELDGWTLPEADGSRLTLYVGENVGDFMKTFVPTKEHYLFDEWLYEGKSIPSSLTMPSGGLTLAIGYKIEVTLKAMVEALDESGYVHESDFDIVEYDYVGNTHVFGEPSIPGLSISNNNTFADGELKVSVTDDYTKNCLEIKYERNTLTYNLVANYPSGSGMGSAGNNILRTGTLTFGESVDVYMELSCDGYLFVGWSTSLSAAEPEYAVDSISSHLQVWEASSGSYVLCDCEPEEVLYAPNVSEALYGVWVKGYVNMHGSNDVIYVLDGDAATAYLYRGGYFFQSTEYYSGTGEYYFGNMYTGEKAFYCVKLGDGGMFSIYDSSHFDSNVYYKYYQEVSFSSSSYYPTMSSYVEETEYLRFGVYDDVLYFVGGRQVGEGTYVLDGSECYITINRGDYAGQSFVVYLTYATYTDGTLVYIFMMRDEEEASMGYLTLGGLYMGDDGAVGEGYYTTDAMFLYLDGYGECMYYDYINGASYYYSYLDGDILWLFSSSGSYTGSFRNISETWWYYYPVLDAEFELQNVSGNKIGTIKLDGACYASTTINGVTTEGYFEVGSLIIGDAVVFYHDKTWEEYLYTYSINYTTYTYDYAFRTLPDSYTEAYYFDSEGLYYQALVLNQYGEDDATYYIYAYDAYYGDYYYYPVVTGTYAQYTNETYGFTYYVFSVDALATATLWSDYDEWWDTYIYYYADMCLDLEEFKTLTEVGFMIDVVYFYSDTYGYYYGYYVDLWLWYSTENKTTLSLSGYAVGRGDDAEAGDGAGAYAEEGQDGNIEDMRSNGGSTCEPMPDSEDMSASGNMSDFDNMRASECADDSVGGYGIALLSEEAESAPWANEDTDTKTYKEYTGSLTLNETSYTVSMLVVADYFVYVTEVSACGGQDGKVLLKMNGEIYGYTTVDWVDANYDAYILYLYVADATEDSGLSVGDLFFVVLSFDDGAASFEQKTEETYYIYAYDSEATDGKSTTSYISYNYFDTSEVMLYTYCDGCCSCTGIVEDSGTTVSGVYLYKFTQTEDVSGEALEFYFVLRYLEDGVTYVFMIYDPDSDMARYTGEDGSSFTEDGLGYGALYIDAKGNQYIVYEGYSYYIFTYDEKQSVGEETGAYGYGYAELYAGGEYVFLDFIGDGTYTVRGSEYGMYMVTGNQLFVEYLILDGYGNVYVVEVEYDEDEGYVYSQIGSGTYSMMDTIATICYSYTEAEGEGSIEFEGVVDGYYIYMYEETFAMSLVDNSDWSVIVLDNFGGATTYLADGTVEYGSYSILDESYFYYISEDGETMGAYRYNLTNTSFEKVDYSLYAATYYNNDMSSSVLFTDYGRVSIDSGSYYYYVVDAGTAYIYYIPEGSNGDVNGYGYAVSEGYDLSSGSVALNGTTYYDTSTLRLSRKDQSSDYGYIYGSSTYELSDITFTPEGSTYSALSGSVYYYNGSSYAANNSLSAYFYRYRDANDTYVMYFVVYTVYNSYWDYCLYYFTVDMEAGTYEITAMELDTPLISYDYAYYYYCYEYYMYYANYYYDYYYTYYYYYLYYGDYTYYYYAMMYYEYFYEYYYYAYYYYSYFEYYYAEIDVWWEYDKDMNVTGTYASGIILPYLIGDMDGYVFYFDSVPVEELSSGYGLIEFENYDGNTYRLTILYYSDFFSASGSYFEGVLAFDVYSLERMYYGVETSHSGTDPYYSVDLGVLVFSEYYYNYIDEVWSVALTYHGCCDEEGGKEIDILTFFEFDDGQDDLFYLASKIYDEETGWYSSTQYYTLSVKWSEDGSPSVDVAEAQNVVTYSIVDADGAGNEYSHLDVITYTDSNGDSVTEVILVYLADVGYGEGGESETVTSVNGTYYVAYECKELEDGSFVFEIYDSTVSDYVCYTVTLDCCNGTATFTLYTE